MNAASAHASAKKLREICEKFSSLTKENKNLAVIEIRKLARYLGEETIPLYNSPEFSQFIQRWIRKDFTV